MVFDLPLFRLELTHQANPRLVSALDVSTFTPTDGGSKTSPYLRRYARGSAGCRSDQSKYRITPTQMPESATLNVGYM